MSATVAPGADDEDVTSITSRPGVAAICGHNMAAPAPAIAADLLAACGIVIDLPR